MKRWIFIALFTCLTLGATADAGIDPLILSAGLKLRL